MSEMEREPQQRANASMTRGASVAVVAGVLVMAVVPVVFLASRHSRNAEAAARSGAAAAVSQQGPDVAALEEAARANPSTANRLNLSLAYINTGRPAQAKTVLLAAAAAEPRSAAVWNNLCVAQIELQELKDAANDCEQALVLDPNFQLAKNNQKWAQGAIKAEQDALAKQEATAPGSRDRDFYLAQGLHEMHLGNYDAAIQSWQKMLLMNTQDAMAANNIGTALMFKKQPKAAAGWFEKAVSWDPSMQIAKNNLAWAQSELPKTGR